MSPLPSNNSLQYKIAVIHFCFDVNAILRSLGPSSINKFVDKIFYLPIALVLRAVIVYRGLFVVPVDSPELPGETKSPLM